MKMGDIVQITSSDKRVRIIGMMPISSSFAYTWPTTYKADKDAYVVLTECPMCGNQREMTSQHLQEVKE